MAIRPRVLLHGETMAKKYVSYKNFLRGITSKHTQSEYINALRNFMAFHKLENYDEVSKFDAVRIDKLITDYIDYLITREVKVTTQRNMLVAIERFFIMNDCVFHKERIRKGLSKDTAIPGGRTPITTEELWCMLSYTKSIRTKCIIHILADTGMRPAGLSDPTLRLKHLVEMRTPTGEKCYALMIYDGSIEGYWAFLTPETTSIVDSYLQSRRNKDEVLSPETPLLMKERNVGEPGVETSGARHIIYNMIKAAGIERIKVSKFRYDKSVMYMFRKRFNTILKINNDVNSNIAEKLMAHKKGLDGTYLQPTREECFTEFVKAIPELTIDPTKRQSIELVQKQNEIDLLEEKSKKIDELEEMISQIRQKNSVEPSEDTKKLILSILKEKKIIS
ncbi:MAG: hypothetical protein ACR2P9_08690 [Gammaproteobacteria bacterium]